jgi:ComF family protein
MSYPGDLISLIYPRLCQVCENSLFRNEQVICMKCRHHLPQIRFKENIANPAAQVFWGRTPLQFVFTAFYYNKGNAVQQLVHRLKYRGNKEIGLFLGGEIGKQIVKTNGYDDINLMIPVPLHPKKQKQRGFNQSEIIARGIARETNIPLNPGLLFRTSYTSTQTRKSKYDRWKNVESMFKVRDKNAIKGKHILLVDDVITTGATLEACALGLLLEERVRVSIAAIAYTRS